jgi:hypothetical protein
MKKCPKCGLPNVEGAVTCDCGYVLQILFGAEREQDGEPDIFSPSKSYDKEQKRPVGPKPVREYERKKTGFRWEYWLVITFVLFALRSLMNQRTDIPLIQPSYKVSFSLADKYPAAGAQQPSSSRTERVLENLDGVTPKAGAALDRLPKDERERFERLQAELIKFTARLADHMR